MQSISAKSVGQCVHTACWLSQERDSLYCSSHNPFPWVKGQAQYYPLWQRYLLFFTGGFFCLAFRILWQMFPIWPVCLLFWVVQFIDEPLRWRDHGGRRRVFYGAALFGASLNAIVTLANDGLMPVAGKLVQSSVWTPLISTSRLPFLADIHHGFSVGDFFIIGALVAMLINLSLEKWAGLPKESVAIGKRLPGVGL